jgi:hypothetical protein
VPEGKKAIFFHSNSMYLYWISNRYPNIPIIEYDPISNYVLEQDPEILLAALRDPDLVLVEFNPIVFSDFDAHNLGMLDKKFLKKDKNKILIEEFYKRLKNDFTIADITLPEIPDNPVDQPYVFWTRNLQ